MSETHVAVVGLGGISMEHFKKLERLEGVRVVGICDLSETLVQAVSERFGVGPGFTDYGRMLGESEPDAVHVLTPPQTHEALVLGALEAGAHVLVEKPIAPSLAEYERMRDTARERGLLLVENYNYRFMRTALRALELQRAGAIGDLVHVDVSLGADVAAGPYADRDLPHFAHELPGGALRNFASHPASLAVVALGEHREVRVAQRRLEEGLPSTNELRALVTFERGTAGIALTSGRSSHLRFSLQGSAGLIDADLLDRRLHLDPIGSPLRRLTGPVRAGVGYLASTAAVAARSLTASHDYYEGFERLLREFYAAVAGEGPPPVTLEEMDAVNRLVEALFAKENQL